MAGPFGRKRSLKQKQDWKTISSNVAGWWLGESSFISCQLCAKHLPVLKGNGLLHSSLSCLIALCTAKACESMQSFFNSVYTPTSALGNTIRQLWYANTAIHVAQNPLPCLSSPQNYFFQRDDVEHVDIKISMLVNSRELEDRSVYLFLTILTESLMLIHVKM